MNNSQIINSSRELTGYKHNILFISVSVFIVLIAIFVRVGLQAASANTRPEAISSSELIQDEKGYLQVSFKYLSSYKYVSPTEKEIEEKNFKNQVPQYINDLNGKMIAIEGFLLPSEFEGKKLKKLVLFNTYLGCCFGNIPAMNEWIYVDMKKAQGMKFTHGMYIKVYGTLEVGEVVDWDGGLSLYRMKGDKIESLLPVKKWWQFWK